MKSLNLIVITLVMGSVLLFMSCTNGGNIVKIGAVEYEMLKADADKWKEVDKLSKELLSRRAAADLQQNAIIDTTDADTYLLNYKYAKTPPPRPSAGVDFDKESLAFLIKYMLDNNINTVRAGFGIYSNTVSPKKDGFATIIFGLPKKVTRAEWEKNEKETAMIPFKLGKLPNGNDTIPPGPDGFGFVNWGEVSP